MRKSLILPAALLFAATAVAGAEQTAKPMQKPAAQPATPAAPAAQPSAPQAGKPESVQDRASYVIGFNLGRTLKHAYDVKALAVVS